jgi:hypothetical protein
MNKVEEIDRIENDFLAIPSSREWHTPLCQAIIDLGSDRDMIYGGAYYVSSAKSYFEKFLKDEPKYVFDMILNLPKPRNRPSNIKKPTSVYGEISQYFYSIDEMVHVRTAPLGKRTVFFFGELHDISGYVHWCTCILDLIRDCIIWFDPAIGLEDQGQSYDFKAKERIISSFQRKYFLSEELSYICRERPQYVCETGAIAVDRFCQSWVILFLDMFVNELETQFMQLKFRRYQTMIIKSWWICWLSKLDWWESAKDTTKCKQLEKKLSFCVLKTGDNHYGFETITGSGFDCEGFKCCECIIIRYISDDDDDH